MASQSTTTTNQSKRTYSAAHFALELDDNHKAGFFRSVEGGGVKTDILTYRAGNSPALYRQLAKPKYEDLKLQVGMSMSQTFYKWIEAFFTGKVERKSGAILAGDFHFVERARRQFYDALIAEVAIPKLDATDRNACYMGVTLVPETMRFAPGGGVKLDPTVGSMSQKLWTPNNFEFTLDNGFDASCARVTRVDGFTIKQQILEYPTGNRRDAARVPGMIEFPNISFYVPEADSRKFVEHFTKHVIEGKPQEGRITGSITFKDHSGGDLCRINMYGIDFSNVAPDKSDSTSQEIKQVRVEISCERMEFAYLGSPSGGGSAQ